MSKSVFVAGVGMIPFKKPGDSAAYHEMGATAVAIVAPYYYKLSPRAVYAYFKEIADNTPIDVTLYNIPMFASPIDVPTIQRLSEEFERIVAIKDSTGDVPNMIRMIQAVRPNRPEFAFMTGWDAALMPMLLIGYGVALVLTLVSSEQFVNLAWDSAGVTTGSKPGDNEPRPGSHHRGQPDLRARRPDAMVRFIEPWGCCADLLRPRRPLAPAQRPLKPMTIATNPARPWATVAWSPWRAWASASRSWTAPCSSSRCGCPPTTSSTG